jgi:transposase
VADLYSELALHASGTLSVGDGAAVFWVPLLLSVPGISCVPAYTIAAEIGNIGRLASPRRLAGYSGLCPLRSTVSIENL